MIIYLLNHIFTKFINLITHNKLINKPHNVIYDVITGYGTLYGGITAW